MQLSRRTPRIPAFALFGMAALALLFMGELTFARPFSTALLLFAVIDVLAGTVLLTSAPPPRKALAIGATILAGAKFWMVLQPAHHSSPRPNPNLPAVLP